MPCETQRIYQPEREKDKDRKKSKKKIQQQAKTLGWQLTPGKDKNTVVATKPFSKDKIIIEVLKSGSVKVTVPGKISAANHSSAEVFLNTIQMVIGPIEEMHHIHGGAAHSHAAAHQHDH